MRPIRLVPLPHSHIDPNWQPTPARDPEIVPPDALPALFSETAGFFLERNRNVIATIRTPPGDVRGCNETRRSRASSLRTDHFREDDFAEIILPFKRTLASYSLSTSIEQMGLNNRIHRKLISMATVMATKILALLLPAALAIVSASALPPVRAVQASPS